METLSNGEQRYCPTPLVIRLKITDRAKGGTNATPATTNESCAEMLTHHLDRNKASA